MASNLSADARIIQQASKSKDNKTASPEITNPTSTTKSQQPTPTEDRVREVDNEASSTTASENKFGRVRHPIEDRTNLSSQVTIQQSVAKIVESQVAESQQTIESTATSVQQRVQELQNLTFVSTKSKNDATRALQKLQTRCNHKYNRNTKRCEFCNKHRDSHVYDQ